MSSLICIRTCVCALPSVLLFVPRGLETFNPERSVQGMYGTMKRAHKNELKKRHEFGEKCERRLVIFLVSVNFVALEREGTAMAEF